MAKTAKFLLSALVLLVFFCIFIVAGGLWYMFSPLNQRGTPTSFIVTKGDSVASISQKLVDQHLMRSPLALRILYKIDGKNQAIQPGTYKIAANMSPQSILTTLYSETQDAWVTLKEGWRSEEIAQELSTKLHPTFNKEAFIELAQPVEGKLFPDTYLLSKDMDAQGVFAKLTSTFESKYAKALETDGPGVLPKKETIILASLVEREGRGQTDTRMVAGILKNRIDAGMPLQVDATLQYAKGFDQQNQTWWGQPKAADKESADPYNTYKNLGLPPGAICNPGLISLQSALKPTPSEYLYYIHDTQGKPHYAKTYEEHQKNIEMYLR